MPSRGEMVLNCQVPLRRVKKFAVKRVGVRSGVLVLCFISSKN